MSLGGNEPGKSHRGNRQLDGLGSLPGYCNSFPDASDTGGTHHPRAFAHAWGAGLRAAGQRLGRAVPRLWRERKLLDAPQLAGGVAAPDVISIHRQGGRFWKDPQQNHRSPIWISLRESPKRLFPKTRDGHSLLSTGKSRTRRRGGVFF